MSGFYADDLAHVHHTGFGAFSRDAAPGIVRLLERAQLRDGLVVDLGCGSGILARELLLAGYDVLGIDASAAMVGIARETAPGARFLVGSLHETDLPACAAVTAIGEAVTYLNPNAGPLDPSRLFARVREALAPGGVFVFDVVLRSEGEPMRYRGTREGPDWRVDVEVREEPERSRLTRRIVTVRRLGGVERRGEEVHVVQTFSRAEVEALLRASGFTVRVHRSYGAAPLPPRRLAFSARKPRRA
ncbi:MAG TPA: class I SAM-dependent methyltransferase [Longimicrobiaceae bacterium]